MENAFYFFKNIFREADRFPAGRSASAASQRSVKRIKAGIAFTVEEGGFAFFGLSFLF